MPIKCEQYHFLKHDSFVNCSQLKEVSLEKFLKWKLVGTVLQEDVDLIIGTIKDSPMETIAYQLFKKELLVDAFIERIQKKWDSMINGKTKFYYENNTIPRKQLMSVCGEFVFLCIG